MAHLIMTVEEMKNRDKWLEVRRMGIGGSDAAVIVGKNPWKSPFELWTEKTGKVEPDDLSDNEAVYWGTVLEDLVAKRFEEVTGKKVRRCGTMAHDDYPYMLANVDRLVVTERAGLEIKTANGFKAKAWEGDEVPDAYYLQCQWYLFVTGLEKWYIACLIGGQRFVWKEIPRNEDDIKALRNAAQLFWEVNVERGVAPDLDGSEGTTEALGAMYDKPSDGSIVNLPSAAQAAIETLDQLAVTEKIIAEQKAQAQNVLKAMLGNFETDLLQDRKVTWKMTKGRETVSTKELKEQYPDVYRALVKVGAPTRRFSVK